ncbi:MAG: hypothetical protein VX413_05940 [Verrucomicrobiota bacterium]|nr:hypothetical protein [Verrucomicrobiota bacterium]
MKNLIITTITTIVSLGCSITQPTTQPPGRLVKEPLRFQITSRLEIPSDDGQQGIATDGKHAYVQNSQQLFKYQLDGTLIKAGPKLELHHGGIVYVNGLVYAAVSGCEPTGSTEHHVHIYNARTLELIKKHDIGEYFTVCAGGIAHREGHFFVAESFFDNEHLDRVVEFDSSFRHIKTHTIEFKSPFGIQGLEYLPSTGQFQIHSHGKAFYRINDHFKSETLIEGQSEFELQDLALLNSETLLVNHRAAQTLEFVKLKMDDN